MTRIIINARGVSDAAAVDHVASSIREGKISESHYGAQYCFAIRHDGIMTICKLNKSGTYTFWVYPETVTPKQ
jgi:hypothetical protein